MTKKQHRREKRKRQNAQEEVIEFTSEELKEKYQAPNSTKTVSEEERSKWLESFKKEVKSAINERIKRDGI